MTSDRVDEIVQLLADLRPAELVALSKRLGIGIEQLAYAAVGTVKYNVMLNLSQYRMNGEPFKKIQTIKVVRSLTGMGLKDAKDFVDALESTGYGPLATEVSEKQAKEWEQEMLRGTGMKVELVQVYT